jgi:hypothetical protein
VSDGEASWSSKQDAVYGTVYVLDRRSSKGRWQASIPLPAGSEDMQWTPHRASEADGLTIVEGATWTYGTLDAFEAATGRPLWRYIFLNTPQLLSTHGMGPGRTRYALDGLDADRERLARLREAPPAGFAAAPEGERAPVVVDPATPDRTATFRLWAAAWAPVAVLALLIAALARRRRRTAGTAAYALLALGVFLVALVALQAASGYAFAATVVLKALLVVTLVQAIRAAWTVERRRFRWPLRVALMLAVLAAVPFGLMLMLLA